MAVAVYAAAFPVFDFFVVKHMQYSFPESIKITVSVSISF